MSKKALINYQLIDFYVLVCLMIDFHENLLLLVKISIFIICDFLIRILLRFIVM